MLFELYLSAFLERVIGPLGSQRREHAEGLETKFRGYFRFVKRKTTAGIRFFRRMRSRIRGAGILGLPVVRVHSLPAHSNPTVSILVPVHNNIRWTLMCLQALSSSGESTTFEVIVINDASTDSTRKRLERIGGLRVLNLKKNVGFLLACNKGLELAQGEFVVYLNNDTEVESGWLDALIENFEDQLVGLVGAKLVYPDGRLQEAGGIVFSDASAWNFGRFEKPLASPFTYRREVDYVSGAAIAVRKSILDNLGGFDERFVPAYYEDTDLAFEVRRQGFKVLYEPYSVVVHHEGISHGTDENSGLKAFQLANKEKFFQKWKATLESQDGPGGQNVQLSARKLTSGRGTILILDEYPTWNHDSGSRRLLEILVSFRRRGFNVLLIPSERKRKPPYDRDLSNLGVQVWHDTISEAQDYVAKIADDIVLVFAARPSNMISFMEYFDEILPGVPVIFDTVDLHFLRRRRERNFSRFSASRKELFSLEMEQSHEVNLMKQADLTLVVSPVELALLSDLDPDLSIELLSNVHRVVDFVPGAENRGGILFVANFNHGPNLDGIEFFLREVYPLLVKKVKTIRFSIVGSPKPESVENLNLPGVEVLGWVEDLDPLYSATRLVIAPLRFGAGVKGKVGEAWAHGVPSVMTSIAAEGMGVVHGENGLIADDPDDFAECIVKLLQDNVLWKKMSLKGQTHVESILGQSVFEKAIDLILNKFGLGK